MLEKIYSESDYDDVLARSIIEKFNLRPSTLATWRANRRIPPKYIREVPLVDVIVGDINVSKFISDHNISVTEFCSRVGMSRMGFWKWQNGKANISTSLKNKILNFIEDYKAELPVCA